MAAKQEITCPMCGFKNPSDRERCHSCGAKVEAYTSSQSAEEQYARRYQQDDFEWKWALLATAVLTALQVLVLLVLPAVLTAFDPQGLPGLMVSVPVAFGGGVLVGLFSPGKTFIEPAVGAMIAAVPTAALVAGNTPEGFQPTALAYVICAAMAVMMALFGAFLGEKVQMSKTG